MGRKCVALATITALVVLMAPGMAAAKAIKQEVAVTPAGTAKVILNYSAEEFQVIVNVNCSGLEPETTYTVAVFDAAGLQVASEEFTTKPDKSQGKNDKAKKTKNFKSKGHVNIHIPWDPLALPPDLTLWSVTVAEVVPVVPPPPGP